MDDNLKECVVCFENTHNLTLCNHSICPVCIEKLKTYYNTCPMCRAVIFSYDLTYKNLKLFLLSFQEFLLNNSDLKKCFIDVANNLIKTKSFKYNHKFSENDDLDELYKYFVYGFIKSAKNLFKNTSDFTINDIKDYISIILRDNFNYNNEYYDNNLNECLNVFII